MCELMKCAETRLLACSAVYVTGSREMETLLYKICKKKSSILQGTTISSVRRLAERCSEMMESCRHEFMQLQIIYKEGWSVQDSSVRNFIIRKNSLVSMVQPIKGLKIQFVSLTSFYVYCLGCIRAYILTVDRIRNSSSKVGQNKKPAIITHCIVKTDLKKGATNVGVLFKWRCPSWMTCNLVACLIYVCMSLVCARL